MTKFGENPGTKLTPVSKKKKAEATPEVVDWLVEDFAKGLQYFHDVIGLPSEGKIPKDITVEDVPLAKVEKHWGVKAKNDKNGYKKGGVKGIPVEDIHKLVIALDGVDKFQLFSLEIARGLYYERILKKAVNWAACGVDKHKGQLAWRFRRNSPVQPEVPPWKRVEHKYTPPAGLVVTIDGEEQDLYPAKPREQCEPSEGRKASAVGPAELLNSNKSVKQSDGPSEGTKANDVAPSTESAGLEKIEVPNSPGKSQKAPGEGRKANDVAPSKEPAGPEKIEEVPNSPQKSQKDPGEGRNASNIAIEEPARPEKIEELPNSPEKSDKATGEGRKASNIAALAQCVASGMMESNFAPEDHRLSTPSKSSNLNCAATSEDCQILEERSTPAINYMPALIQMGDVPAPKQEILDGLTFPLAPRKQDLLLESWLDIVERNWRELSSEIEKLNLDIAKLKARMEVNKKHLQSVDEECRTFRDTMTACRDEVLRLRSIINVKLAEIREIQVDISLRADDDLGTDNGDKAKLLSCCAEANSLQESVKVAQSKHAEAFKTANDLLPSISKLNDVENSMLFEMQSFKRTAARLTRSHNALSAEWVRLQQLVDKGVVQVNPVSMVCPLQSEDSFFPITECPICSLGFYCNNWVPTPCGHCYHPNCLFSLLKTDDNRAPKCEACFEVFHPDWLQCWGLPQVNHPEVVKLVDDWGLAEQANSFKLSLADLYCTNASNIDNRRMAQAAKQKKVTTLYSHESIQKSVQYHGTVGKAELINHEVMRAKSKADHKVVFSEAKGADQDIVLCGTKGNWNSPCITAETGDDLPKVLADLSIVKKEKGAPELGSIVECVSSATENAPEETPTSQGNKKRKAGGENKTEGKDVGTTDQSKVLADLSIVKKEKGALELDSIVECVSSATENACEGTPTKRGKKKRKVGGETKTEGKDVGTTNQSQLN